MDSEKNWGPRFVKGANSPDGSTEAARLIAAKMVIRGRTSTEIADHLRNTYGIEDVDELLEEVGASPE
jgi:hypothetical protein